MWKKKNFISKHSTPFLILVMIHLIMLIRLLSRTNKKESIILLLSNIGWAYLFEYITLNIFKAYKYKPFILKDKFLDSILGAILSQGIFVPITSTYLTMLKKNWKWKIAASFIYYCIEHLFLFLKIYQVNWYRPRYTLLLLNVYFFISDHFQKALTNSKNWARVIAHYLSNVVVWVTILFFYVVKRRMRFGKGFMRTWYEHFIIAPLYSLLLSLLAVVTSSKSNLSYRFILFGIQILIDKVLMRMNILKLKSKSFLNNTIRYLIMVYISRLLHKMIYPKS